VKFDYDAISDPDELLFVVGQQLSDAVEVALPGWVERSVTDLFAAWSGFGDVDDEGAIAHQSALCVAEIVPKLRALVSDDVDGQGATPLQILRGAVKYPATVLKGMGVPEVMRDPMVERLSPGDVYGLEPATLADIDPSLHEVGLVWGASKAKAHLARRAALSAPVRTVYGALVPDLMDGSKLRRLEPSPTFVRSVAALVDLAPQVAIVDLTRVSNADELAEIARVSDRVVGFGPHVEPNAIRDAASLGVEAMPRSRFFADIGKAVAGDSGAGNTT
jgi:hypothetical protein